MICKAIESVLAQKYTNWELLIVDDGSVDNTRQVVEAYRDSRINYIYQQNAERSAARNNGIAHAKGQYVCFIDSDDYYYPIHLASFYDAVSKDNFLVAFYFGHTAVDIDGKVEEPPYEPVAAKNNIEFFIFNTIGIPRSCIHIDILKKHQFNPSISIGEDTELWTRIAREYPIHCINKYTQAYTDHADRSVSDVNTKPLLSSIVTLKHIFTNFSKQEISAGARAHSLGYAYFRLAQSYRKNHKFGKMLGALVNSTINTPYFRPKEKVYMVVKGFQESVLGKK
jgi:glycosyltransferase involved in cell wall biosynthesis